MKTTESMTRKSLNPPSTILLPIRQEFQALILSIEKHSLKTLKSKMRKLPKERITVSAENDSLKCLLLKM
jgi:hypothetical protein